MRSAIFYSGFDIKAPLADEYKTYYYYKQGTFLGKFSSKQTLKDKLEGATEEVVFDKEAFDKSRGEWRNELIKRYEQFKKDVNEEFDNKLGDKELGKVLNFLEKYSEDEDYSKQIELLFDLSALFSALKGKL